MAWIDHHCHLPVGAGEERNGQARGDERRGQARGDEADGEGATVGSSASDIVADAKECGVARLVTVGTTVEHSQAMLSLAEEFDDVWATAGVHPHEASGGLDGLKKLLAHPKAVAVGEAGLDFHYDHSPRKTQASVFAAQIDLANERSLPLVIHSRSAWEETFDTLDKEGVPERLVFHCFTGGTDELQECLGREGVVSFSGIITFAKATELREAAFACPLERLLVETDSPYLAPVPHRGRPNRPALLPLVGKVVADVKDIEVEEVEDATWGTAETFYGLGGS